jgi:NADPH:quinone reductase-like Zn-dependent oxidoreductase/acyl carrier protein
MLAQAGFTAPAPNHVSAGAWPVGLVAARREGEAETAAAAPGEAPVAIVVAEHGDAVAALLAGTLIAAGGQAQVIVPPEIGDGAKFCEALSSFETGTLDVIVLPRHAGRDGAPAVTASNSIVRIVTIARLIELTRERTRLWLVTEDAQQHGERDAPESAALWGLGRTIANEMPQLGCRLLDLSSSLPAEQAARHLAAELAAPDGETEIVVTPSGRHALRLRRGFAAQPVRGPILLSAATPGRLDSLTWRSFARREPGPGEVAIDVRAVGLNFRDVMWALDLLPEEALLGGHAGPTLGLECAGIVRAVGPGVVDFGPGDCVAAIAPAALATDVITTAATVMRVPEGLDFAAAATLPVAFVTVIYALGHLARLQAGERVLIHGGAGGVGIAAIQFAKHRGAEVIATAGSPAKRAFLRQLGADHVFDSRDLSFVGAIKSLTGGRGVDVVLNSLSGDAMEQSLGLVRPFGRFLELGKRDFFLGTRVALKPLRRNVAYFAVDIDGLPVEQPALATELMRQAIDLIGQGALRPLPYRDFAFAEAGDAFRLMQASGHIGKIVLTADEPAVAPEAAVAAFAVRSDATYLVTGGLSGFGLATAEWLAARGARSLALLGRRGAETPGAAEALARLTAAGVDARAFACDVTDGDALAATLAAIRRDMKPLRGIVHAAMQLDDALLGDLDFDRTMRVLAPKLGGALHLDRLTRDDPIELFILYSSATTVLGAPGQGSYVAANLALEGVARRRRAAGLPAFVVGWGPIGDAGYLARNEGARDALARRLAANPISAAEALDALPALYASGEIAVAFASVRWDTAQRLLPALASPTFTEIADARFAGAESNLRERLAELPPEERKDLVLTVLMEEVTRILSTSAEALDAHRPVSELGMDSLMAVELRLALEGRLGVSLPMLSLSQQTSLAMIATRLAASVSSPADAGRDVAAAAQRYETADPDALRVPFDAAKTAQSAAAQ